MAWKRVCVIALVSLWIPTTFAQSGHEQSKHEEKTVDPLEDIKDSYQMPLDYEKMDEFDGKKFDICKSIWGEQKVAREISKVKERLKAEIKEIESGLPMAKAIIKVRTPELVEPKKIIDQAGPIAKELEELDAQREAALKGVRATYVEKEKYRNHDWSFNYHTKKEKEAREAIQLIRQGRASELPEGSYDDISMHQAMIKHHRKKLSDIPEYRKDLARTTADYEESKKHLTRVSQARKEKYAEGAAVMSRIKGKEQEYFSSISIDHSQRMFDTHSKAIQDAKQSIADAKQNTAFVQAKAKAEIEAIRRHFRYNPPNPPNIVIAFEGTGVWAPRSFRQMHFQRHQFDDIYTKESADKLHKVIGKHRRNDSVESPGLLSGHLFRVFEGGALGDPRFSLEQRRRTLDNDGFKDTEIFYFSEVNSDKMDKKALACIKQMYKPYKDENGEKQWPSLTVVGYSSGAKRAIEFSKMLDNAKESSFYHGKKPDIDLFVAIDAVEHWGLAGTRAIGQSVKDLAKLDPHTPTVDAWHDSKHFGVGGNVKKSISFIQNTDETGLKKWIYLRGSPIRNPDNDPRHTYEYVDLPDDEEEAGHYYISQNPYVSNEISKAFVEHYKKLPPTGFRPKKIDYLKPNAPKPDYGNLLKEFKYTPPKR